MSNFQKLSTGVSRQTGVQGTDIGSGSATSAQFLAANGTGGSAFRLLAAADLPTITLTGNVTGAASAGSISTTIATGVVTNAMLAGSIDLTSKVTGTLPVLNGGTGVTTKTGTGNVVLSAAPTFSGAVTFGGSTNIGSGGNLAVQIATPTVSGTVPQTNNSQVLGSLRVGGGSNSVNDDALINLSTYGFLSSDNFSSPVWLGWNIATKSITASSTVIYTPLGTTGFGYSGVRLGLGGNVDFYTSNANTTGGGAVTPFSVLNLTSAGPTFSHANTGADQNFAITNTSTSNTNNVSINAVNDTGASFNNITSNTTSGTQHWYIGGNGTSSTLVFKTGGTVRATVDASGNLQTSFGRATQGYDTSILTSGTITCAANKPGLVINSAGGTALTIKLPPSPLDGQQYFVASVGAFTIITWQDSGGTPTNVVGGQAAIGGVNRGQKFVYSTALAKWLSIA